MLMTLDALELGPRSEHSVSLLLVISTPTVPLYNSTPAVPISNILIKGYKKE